MNNWFAKKQASAAQPSPTRRTVLGGFLALSVAGAITACSSGSNQGANTTAPTDFLDALSSDRVMPKKGGPAKTETPNVPYPEGYEGPKAFSIEKIVDRPVKLKIAIPQSAIAGNWENNKFTKWYAERTGVDVEWITLPGEAQDAATRLNAMFSSNDLPDMISGGHLTPTQTFSWAQQKQLIPLQGLMQDYAPNTLEAVKSYEFNYNSQFAPDGNLYSFPDINDCYHCRFFWNKAFIYKPFLEQVGMEMPTTLQELEDAMTAIVEKTDAEFGFSSYVEIPIDSYFPQSWGYSTTDPWLIVKDGKVDVSFKQEGWRKSLAYMASLVDKKLLDPRHFNQTSEQMQRLTAANKVAVLGVTNEGAVSPDLKEQVKWQELGPLKGPDGAQVATWDYNIGINFGQAAITSACQTPEVAVAWLDNLMELETTLRSNFGALGEDWEWGKSGEFGANGRSALYSVTPVPEGKTNVGAWVDQKILSYRSVDVRDGQAQNNTGQSQEQVKAAYEARKQRFEPYKEPEDQQFPLVFQTPEQAAQLPDVQVTLTNFIKQTMQQVVDGKIDFTDDAAWQKFQNDLTSRGLDTYLQINQAAYDATKNK